MKSVLILISMLMPAGHAAVNTDLQMMHTKPVCNHPDKSPSWCDIDDIGAVTTASAMVEKIVSQIELAKDPTTATVSVGYFSFSNKPIFRALCARARDGITVDFFLDTDFKNNELTNFLKHGACTKEQQVEFKTEETTANYPELKNVRLHYLGAGTDSGTWRLHHNKFLIVNPGKPNQEIKINFSSGNLTTFGTSLHFDHWVTATTTADSNLYKSHACVVDSMIKAAGLGENGTDDPETYRKSLDKCLNNINALSVADAVKQEKIAPMFSPNPKNEIAKVLIQEIDKVKNGETIVGAMQHFLHEGIAEALVDACERGVSVKMIMDDDIITGEGEVAGADKFYQNELEGTCISTQFMHTNAEVHQMMHNKFLVLGNTRVFAGAGQFTYAAMKDNYENFYLMEDSTVHAQYKDLFKFMWDMSLTKKEVLKNQNQ